MADSLPEFTDPWAQRIEALRRLLLHAGPVTLAFFLLLGGLVWTTVSVLNELNARADAIVHGQIPALERIAAAVEDLADEK